VAKSSDPPIRSVFTFDVRTRSYWFSLAFAGHASANSPPPQMKRVPGSPRMESLRWSPDEKWRFAVSASARPAAAIWPQTNEVGKAKSASSDWNQNPLASP
jgi:hypothetical protein